jgi:hypothetical protein
MNMGLHRDWLELFDVFDMHLLGHHLESRPATVR